MRRAILLSAPALLLQLPLETTVVAARLVHVDQHDVRNVRRHLQLEKQSYIQ